MSETKIKKPFYKRWWFITICVLFLIVLIAPKQSKTVDSKNTDTEQVQLEKKCSPDKELLKISNKIQYLIDEEMPKHKLIISVSESGKNLKVSYPGESTKELNYEDFKDIVSILFIVFLKSAPEIPDLLINNFNSVTFMERTGQKRWVCWNTSDINSIINN